MLPPPLNLFTAVLYFPHYGLLHFQHYVFGDNGNMFTSQGPDNEMSLKVDVISLADTFSDVVLFVLVGIMPLSILKSLSLTYESIQDLDDSTSTPVMSNKDKNYIFQLLRKCLFCYLPSLALVMCYPFLWVFCLLYDLCSFRWIRVVIEPYWRRNERYNDLHYYQSNDWEDGGDASGVEDVVSSKAVMLSNILQRHVIVFPDESMSRKDDKDAPEWGTAEWYFHHVNDKDAEDVSEVCTISAWTIFTTFYVS